MMTPQEFEAFAYQVVARARHIGGDVHVFLIVTPRGDDVGKESPLSTGTLDAAGQVAVLRSIADSLEKNSPHELFAKPIDDAKS